MANTKSTGKEVAEKATPKKTTKKKTAKPKSGQTVGKAALDGHIPSPVIAATEEQYEEIIKLLWHGSNGGAVGAVIKPSKTIAIILQVEANTGLRIGDVLRLRLDDIIHDGNRFRFHMREHKTGKLRTFTVPDPIYHMLEKYANKNGISHDAPLFNMTVRNVQRKLDQVTDYLGYRYLGTHSFRKRFATCAYETCHDIEIVRRLMQHSSSAVTLRYIGISDDKIEKVLRKVVNIVESY